MDFLKHNLAVLIVLCGCVVSYFVGRVDSQRRDRSARSDSVQGCIRASHRTALQAAAWQDAAATRRLGGDFEAGHDYEAFADSLIETIPAPKGYQGLRILAEVERVAGVGAGSWRFNLTPVAKRLQIQGCEEFYRRF